MRKSLGMTKYGVLAADSGCPCLLVKAVCGWKQQSVFSLHSALGRPSQSMSMSAVKWMAPSRPQMATCLPASVR